MSDQDFGRERDLKEEINTANQVFDATVLEYNKWREENAEAAAIFDLYLAGDEASLKKYAEAGHAATEDIKASLNDGRGYHRAVKLADERLRQLTNIGNKQAA